MFEYTICKDNSAKEFKRACRIIASNYPELNMEPLLIDVDGSTIQPFTKAGKKVIIIYDDYDIGVVFLKSEKDVSGCFR